MPIFTQPRIRGRSYLEEMGTSQAASNRAAAELNIDPVEYLSRIQQLDEAQYGKPVTAPGIFPPIQTGREPVDSPVLSAETARARVTENQLDLTIPDDGIPERALEILIERKRRERVLQDTIHRAPQGIGPGAIRFGATLASSMLDPINIASAFVPVVGAARAASMFAKTSSFMGRVGVRARIGAIEGAVGAAIVEPIVGIGAISEQSDYNLATILTDLGGGTILGGGLHVVAGGVGDVATRTRAGRAATFARTLDAAEMAPTPTFATTLRQAAPETREALLRVSVAQMAEGRAVNVDALARLDPVIRGEVPGASAVSQTVDIHAPDLAAEVARVVEQTQAAKAAPDRGPSGEFRVRPVEVTDSHRGEMFGVKALDADGKVQAAADVSILDDIVQIQMIQTRAGSTRKGYATALVDDLFKEFPDKRIKLSSTTEDGAAFFGSRYDVDGDGFITPKRAAASLPRSPRPITYTRPSDRPVSPQAWAELQSNAHLGAVAESTLSDTVAAREADELLKARAGKDDDDTAAITEETDAILADLDVLARGAIAGIEPSPTERAGLATMDEYYAAAPLRQKELEDVAYRIAGENDIKFKTPGIKKRATAEEKIKRKGYRSLSQVTDIVRGGFVVKTPSQADAVAAGLAAKFDVLDEGWKVGPTGYIDRKILVRFSDGVIGEVQMWHPEMLAAKDDVGHKLYEAERSLPIDDPRRAGLQEHQREVYAAATAKFGDDWEVAFAGTLSEPKVPSKPARQSVSETTQPESTTSAESTRVQSSPGDSFATAQAPSSSAGRFSQFTNNMEMSPSTRNMREVDAEINVADRLIEDADTYGRAAEAMANCQLRRGVL